MKTYILFLSFLVLLLTTCKKQTSLVVEDAIEDTLQVEQKKTISSIGESLSPKAKSALKSWEEYQLVDQLLTRYYAISNAEALSNAVELSDLTQHLKDSIRDKQLETPSVRARLNLLYSESKRLEDMVEIPSIKPEEVVEEIKKILDAFSAVNAKFNSVYAVTELENELDLDPDFQAMIQTPSEETITTYKVVETKDQEVVKPKTIATSNQKRTKTKSAKKNLKALPKSIDLKSRKKLQIERENIRNGDDKEALFKKEETLKKRQEIKK